MLSISQLRANLYSAFKIMKNTGNTFDVIYENKVYEVNVRKTDKKPIYERTKRARSELMPHSIDVSQCPTCEYVLVAGVCMNKKCPTNK